MVHLVPLLMNSVPPFGQDVPMPLIINVYNEKNAFLVVSLVFHHLVHMGTFLSLAHIFSALSIT